MKLKNIIVIITVLGAFGLLGYVYIWYKQAFSPNVKGWNDTEYLYIEQYDNFEKVFTKLKPFLNDAEAFKTIADQRSYPSSIMNGRFKLKNGMNNFELIQALRINVPTRVTFNNQERIENLAGRLSAQIESDSITILETLLNHKFLEDNGLTKENVLTAFIPDTYEFYWNVHPIKLRNKLYSEYQKFWNAERREKAEKLGLSPTEVSILASIVQKETIKVDERPKVAGAYLNRLKLGMPLQADPTVVYAYKLYTNDFDQKLFRVYNKHLEINSPYNTYQLAGLPPGPITMPDKNAIDAVLNPEQHDYIYFCASVDRMGYHEFAKTLSQHNINSAKYHRYLNQQGIK